MTEREMDQTAYDFADKVSMTMEREITRLLGKGRGAVALTALHGAAHDAVLDQLRDIAQEARDAANEVSS